MTPLIGIPAVLLGLAIAALAREALTERAERRRSRRPGDSWTSAATGCTSWSGDSSASPTVILIRGWSRSPPTGRGCSRSSPRSRGSSPTIALDLGGAIRDRPPRRRAERRNSTPRSSGWVSPAHSSLRATPTAGSRSGRSPPSTPHEVAGMVLVDGSHPDQWMRFGSRARCLATATRLRASPADRPVPAVRQGVQAARRRPPAPSPRRAHGVRQGAARACDRRQRGSGLGRRSRPRSTPPPEPR